MFAAKVFDKLLHKKNKLHRSRYRPHYGAKQVSKDKKWMEQHPLHPARPR